MDFTKTIINAIKIWVNKQLSFIENKISDLEDRPSAFIQPEEPNEAPDGTLWIDTDEDSISGVGSNTAESLTFTGVVEATYNGLSPVTVNIPKVTVNGVTSDENGNIEIEVGSEQVQTDWNQNDSTQPDYIKNRTHWIEGSTYHTLNDNFIPETIARTSAVEEIKTLVGETPVSEQIEAAIAGIPEVEIPEQVQSDWNQTENTAVDYIKNRPFGEVDITQTITRNDLSFSHMQGYYFVEWIKINEAVGDNLKKMYVTWDGVTYDCKIMRIPRTSTQGTNMTQYICGNGALYYDIVNEYPMYDYLDDYTFEDTGEPFAFTFSDTVLELDMYLHVPEGTSDAANAVTSISIEIEKTISKTIDEIYIPDTIARIEDIPEGFSGSWNDLEDKPFYEENVQTIIEWDGSTDGRDSVSPTDGLTLVKVHDLVDATDLIGATLYLSDGNTIVLTSDNIASETDMYIIMDPSSYNTYLYGVQALSVSGITFPSTGLYAAVGDVYFTKLELGEVIIHTIDEKFIPDSIIAQSDWNQTDETALDFIKNRPFYMEEKSGIYLMQSKARTYEPAGDTGYYYVYETLAAQPIVGNTYTVRINNRSYYSQQCKKFPDTSAESYIGNVGLLGSTYENTGETYLIVVNMAYTNGQSMIMSAVAADTSSSYIYGTALMPVPIDEKYLPDSVKTIVNTFGVASNLNTENKNTLVDAINEVAANATTQSNWIQEDESAVDYIKNKPEITLNRVSLMDHNNGYKYHLYLYNGELVIQMSCDGIEVTTMPTKTTYWANEEFDPSGMVISAIYQDGSKEVISDYSIQVNRDDGTVTIVYETLDMSYSTSFAIFIDNTTFEDKFVDFTYTVDGNNVTLESWKGTKNGVSSTDCTVPDCHGIVQVIM